jgi:diphthine-ammonia ligase
VESVCSRLGLVSLAYMWQQPQRQLLDDMINARIDAVLVKVAAMGDPPSPFHTQGQETPPGLLGW